MTKTIVMRKLLFAALLLQSGYISAQCGTALKLTPGDGVHVWSIDNESMPDVTNNFTMEFWIKPNKTIKTGMTESNTGFEGLSGQNYAVFPGYLPDANACNLAVSVGTNGVAVLDCVDGSVGPEGRMATTLVHYTSISSSDWTHIAIVCNNRTPVLYINGIFAKNGLISTASFVHPSAILGDVSSYGGYGYGPFNWGPTDAIIDEFKIWSVALSASTISNWHDKYTSSSHPDYSNLHTFWRFNEGSGEETTDITGHGHKGVITYTTPPIWIAGWAPAGVTVSAGADENTYYGYTPDQCVTKTANITGGTGPYTYNWTLDRALLPGETMTGASTASVTVCLMDTAQLCVTVTDLCGFTVNDCTMIFAEDVRCGNGQNQKVSICHDGNMICVDANAVPAHIAHGDYVGACAVTRGGSAYEVIPNPVTVESIRPGFNIYPNPSAGSFTITVDADNAAESIRIFNASGQMIRQINIGQQKNIKIVMDNPGVYMVQLVGEQKIVSKKVIVIR